MRRTSIAASTADRILACIVRILMMHQSTTIHSSHTLNDADGSIDPFYFVSCHLMNADPDGKQDADLCKKALLGTTTSSLHKLKDNHGHEGGFFVFGDLSVKNEGIFKLHFDLYEMRRTEAILCTSTESAPFQVHTQRTFPGMGESTWLTRSFSEQGVRLRLRKDSRAATNRKRQLQWSLHSERVRNSDSPMPKRQRQNPSPEVAHEGLPQAEAQTTRSPALQSTLQSRTNGYPGVLDTTYQSPYQGSTHDHQHRTPVSMAMAHNYTTAPGGPNLSMMGLRDIHAGVQTTQAQYWPPTPSSGMSGTSLASASSTQSPPGMIPPTYYRLDPRLIAHDNTEEYEGDDGLDDALFSQECAKYAVPLPGFPTARGAGRGIL